MPGGGPYGPLPPIGYTSLVVLDTKRKFYSAQAKGLTGNALYVWHSVEEWRASGYGGPVALRSTTPGGKFMPFITLAAIRRTFVAGQHMICAHAPDDYLTIQGEMQRSTSYLDLHYSTVPGLTMREALPKYGKHTSGLMALHLLRSHADAASYDDLWDLLDTYPGAVIEFSTYPFPVGRCNRNTIIWEVRQGF